MLEKIGVEVVVEGLPKARRGLKQFEDGLDNTGKAAKKSTPNIKGMFSAFLETGAVIGAIGAVTGAIVEFGKASFEEFQTFEKQSAEVFTLLPDLTSEATESMKADILEFSAAVGRQTDEVVPALYQAISAGVPQENVFDFMQIASDAALGGVTDLETAVDGITSVVNAYGAETIDAARAADVMFGAVKLGKTDFEQLSSSLFNVIPTAASLGISFEDVASSMAVLTSQGTPTSVATTQLRAALVEASKGGTLLDKALRDLSGEGFAGLSAQGMTSAQIFQMLRESMPEQEFKNLFGSVEALNAVLGITGPNADTAAAAFDDISNSAGNVATAAATMEDTAGQAIAEMMAAFEGLKIQLGSEIAPAVTGFVDGVSSELKRFNVEKDVDDAVDSLRDFGLSFRDIKKEIGATSPPLLAFTEEAKLEAIEVGEENLKRMNAALEILEGGFDGSKEELGNLVDEAMRLQQLPQMMQEAASADRIFFQANEQLNESIQKTTELSQVEQAIIQANNEEIQAAALARSEAAEINFEFADKVQQSANMLDMETEAVLGSATAIAQANIVNQEAVASLAAKAEAERMATEAAREHEIALGGYFEEALLAGQETINFNRVMFDSAVAAGAGATELAVLAAATGEFTEAEIQAAFEAALMTANIDTLIASMKAGEITAQQATEALDLLQTGEAATAEGAMAMARSIDGAVTELSAVKEEAINAADALNEIPTEIGVTINIDTRGNIPSLPGQGQPIGQEQAFAKGGFTGRGPKDGIAGLVHFNEVVVPADIIKLGPAFISAFVNENFPGGIKGASPTTLPPSIPAPPSVFDHRTAPTVNKNVQMDFGDTTINNDMDLQILRNFILETVRDNI